MINPCILMLSYPLFGISHGGLPAQGVRIAEKLFRIVLGSLIGSRSRNPVPMCSNWPNCSRFTELVRLTLVVSFWQNLLPGTPQGNDREVPIQIGRYRATPAINVNSVARIELFSRIALILIAPIKYETV